MSRHIEVTVQGIVGTNPYFSHTSGGGYCRFRLASTPSYFSGGQWVQGTTQWFTVKAFGNLARNIYTSVRCGQPVLLTGRLNEETWSSDKGEGRAQVITAHSLGHDLCRGAAVFSKEVPLHLSAEQSGNESEKAIPEEHSTTRQYWEDHTGAVSMSSIASAEQWGSDDEGIVYELNDEEAEVLA
ncbi:single-stranded DNA-binding protein [Actinomyces vulturis]|uniref:single-stranded DNA-binding protein n=1 Tax=Actinomyces vulturis TaxID=1857645 RepID=UPI00082F753F|nr:single-stranded DNA-binding protein [Actinomyces vulturis]